MENSEKYGFQWLDEHNIRLSPIIPALLSNLKAIIQRSNRASKPEEAPSDEPKKLITEADIETLSTKQGETSLEGLVNMRAHRARNENS